MRVQDDHPDRNRDFAPLIEELERFGGALTVAECHSATSSVKAVHLHLPDDEYRAKKCQEVLQQWHSTQD